MTGNLSHGVKLPGSASVGTRFDKAETRLFICTPYGAQIDIGTPFLRISETISKARCSGKEGVKI